MLSGWTSRDRRWPVLIPAELRADGRRHAVRIHNVSARGVMLANAGALPVGLYVDLRARGLDVVGRVVWVADDFAGIRLRERIDVMPLLGRASEAAATARSGRQLGAEAARARRIERTRRIAAGVRIVAGAAVLAMASAGVAHGVYGVLDAPLERAAAAMARSRG